MGANRARSSSAKSCLLGPRRALARKWFSSFGTSVDIGGEGNIGQRFSVTRIGESLLVSAGFSVDAARDNVGVSFAVEPRFLAKSKLGRGGGARVPVAGAFGLE